MKSKRRSGEAVAAQHRKSAGPMKHRLEPRGGARDTANQYLLEVDADVGDVDANADVDVDGDDVDADVGDVDVDGDA